MWRYVLEYASYLDVLRFTEMQASDGALTVCDCQILLRDANVAARVKRWLQCGALGLSVPCCAGSALDCDFVLCYEEVEYEKDPATIVPSLLGSR